MLSRWLSSAAVVATRGREVVLEMQEERDTMLQLDPSTKTSYSWPDMMWCSRFLVWNGDKFSSFSVASSAPIFRVLPSSAAITFK